jgi:hypothetical protein
VLLNESMNAAYLASPEAAARLKSDWFKPELRDAIFPLHMHVAWLIAVTSIEEESVWANP